MSDEEIRDFIIKNIIGNISSYGELDYDIDEMVKSLREFMIEKLRKMKNEKC